MHEDYNEILKLTHETMWDIFCKVEGGVGPQPKFKIQPNGYPNVEESHGHYKFGPDIQEYLTDILSKHYSFDNGLSLYGKHNAAKMAVVTTSPSHLIIQNNEDLEKSEFVAFLDHFTKLGLILEKKMEQQNHLSHPVAPLDITVTKARKHNP